MSSSSISIIIFYGKLTTFPVVKQSSILRKNFDAKPQVNKFYQRFCKITRQSTAIYRVGDIKTILIFTKFIYFFVVKCNSSD